MNVCTFYSRSGDSITHKVQSYYIPKRPDTTCNTFNLLQNHELKHIEKLPVDNSTAELIRVALLQES